MKKIFSILRENDSKKVVSPIRFVLTICAHVRRIAVNVTVPSRQFVISHVIFPRSQGIMAWLWDQGVVSITFRHSTHDIK